MKAIAVIGAGFGDEGKGLMTEYFASKHQKNIVVRFNGGAQAGHTITTTDGKRHVFSHFTANSLLSNDAKGYLSKYFIVNPMVFLKELNDLHNLQVYPITAVHDDCVITTPYDIFINQWLEESRSNNRHGSCGLGIGETIERSEVSKILLTVKDLNQIDYGNTIKRKLENIRAFFINRVTDLGLTYYLSKYSFSLYDQIIDNFIKDLSVFKKNVMTGVNSIKHPFFLNQNIVFEGAQGLMLDQEMGFFPHVTRSNTGLKNIIDFCIENEISDLEVCYVSRCYKTRHGAGPLKHELEEKPYEGIIDLTNLHNDYQGSLRFAYLDLEELEYHITLDRESVELLIEKNKITLNTSIAISCLDQTDTVNYFKNEALHSITSEKFPLLFKNDYINVYASYGPTKEDVILV